MIQDRKSKKGAAAGLIFAAVVLVLVVLLENLSSLLPSVPAVLQPTSQLFTVLKKGAVYSLVAVSMNLLNGFTGLFSLGQAGFMLLGAYTYAILTVPMSAKDTVYYLYGGSAVNFSLPDLFGGVDTPAGLVLGVGLAILLALVCFLVNALSNNWKVTAAVLVPGAAVLTAFYLRDSGAFAGLLPDLLGRFSLLSVFNAFALDHVFDVPGILLYLSMSALLVFLTVQVIQRRRWN